MSRALSVCLVSPHLECIAYTISRSLSRLGYSTDIIALAKNNSPRISHNFYYDRISRIENVNIVNSVPTKQWHWAYFILMPQIREIDIVSVMNQSQHIGIVSSCIKTGYIKTLWQELKEIATYWPCPLHSQSIIFIEGFFSVDLYSFFGKKSHLGFDIHSNFFDDSDLYKEIFSFAWKPETCRKYKLNFIGNRSPLSRSLALQSVWFYLTTLAQDQLNISEEILWIEYGDNPGEVRGVAPQKYIDYLAQSDFTLCPHGYSKLTHRVIESLVLGSIPVLEEVDLELYDLRLEHKMNCVAISKGNWIDGINLCLNMSYREIYDIRCNIQSMIETHLTDESRSRQLVRKLITSH